MAKKVTFEEAVGRIVHAQHVSSVLEMLIGNLQEHLPSDTSDEPMPHLFVEDCVNPIVTEDAFEHVLMMLEESLSTCQKQIDEVKALVFTPKAPPKKATTKKKTSKEKSSVKKRKKTQ